VAVDIERVECKLAATETEMGSGNAVVDVP
jgi:hypothetical protein